ncbi:hypothetical protein CEXT_481811 [Caerostris extrusa]|uniref:Uncharacterized protein n=1 Tax=Caerostris extrusa TaxID=172846 RepID=A0AAV4SXZ7_CAEEX|nr:hypothetical protein CEXT_481811 [Caerostris extrusa]
MSKYTLEIGNTYLNNNPFPRIIPSSNSVCQKLDNFHSRRSQDCKLTTKVAAPAQGKSPPKGSAKVPVPPVPDSPVDNPSSDLDHDPDDGPYNYQGSAPLPKILEAEKDLAHAKVKYDAALGFINLANIICDYELVDKMSTSKMTMEAFHLAEAAYKKTLKHVSDLGLCPLVNCSRHSSAKVKIVNKKTKRTAQLDEFIKPSKRQTAKLKVDTGNAKKDILEIRNGFDQLTVDEPNDGDEQTTPP